MCGPPAAWTARRSWTPSRSRKIGRLIDRVECSMCIRVSFPQSRRVCRSLQACFLFVSLLALVGVSGCAGSPGNTGGVRSGGTTTVTVLITSTANDQLSQFNMILKSLTLTSQAGTTANLISTPINVEFLHVNGISEPLLTVTVPQGVYTAATASVGSTGFACDAIDPSNGYVDNAAFAYGYTPASNVTVNLPSSITISGDSAEVLLNLQVSQSASFDTSDCPLTNTFSITPTFTVSAAGSSTQNEVGLKGLVNATSGADNSFTVTAADGQGCGASGCGSQVSGPVWQVAVDAGTVYQGVGGFTQLTAGMPVDMDAVLEPDGSLRAKRIAVYDTDPSNLTSVIGPALRVPDMYPAFFPVEQLGPLRLDIYSFTFSNTAFQVSGQFDNLQTLPFPASFNATNIVPGQNIYATTHVQAHPSPEWVPATTITLVPQTINGTVSAIGNEGGFRVYTVRLAPYDLFPQFAVQQGQTTLLTSPDEVTVYADSNTQMPSSGSIAPGSVARFYGLVFNDSGTLRMDCARIMDGVPE